MPTNREVQDKADAHAQSISEEFGGAPVLVIVAGDKDAGVNATITGQHIKGDSRMRDILGILQAAIQIVSFKHLSK